MLSRLLTLKEQAILAGLAAAIFLGALVLATGKPSASPGAEVLLDAPAPNTPPALATTVSVAKVTPTPVTPAAPALDPEIAVGVLGAVRRPGLYRLPQGARVSDLIEAASGTTSQAELGDLNLAAPLFDASTLEVPAVGSMQPRNPLQYTLSGTRRLSVNAVAQQAPPLSPTPATQTAPILPSRSINVNTATQQQLETLPGIGPATALKIIEHRRVRPFHRVEDLLEVSGIGPAKLEDLRPRVVVR